MPRGLRGGGEVTHSFWMVTSPELMDITSVAKSVSLTSIKTSPPSWFEVVPLSNLITDLFLALIQSRSRLSGGCLVTKLFSPNHLVASSEFSNVSKILGVNCNPWISISCMICSLSGCGGDVNLWF